MTLDWGDTIATSASPQAALHAAGAGVQAVRIVMDESFSSAFCADRHCNGRIVSFLKGGYNLAALAESVEEHLTALTS